MFWSGVVCGPIFLTIVVWILRRIARAYRRYYKGLPGVSWFGMWLIVIGLKMVRPKHMDTFNGSGRCWFSPRVEAFKWEPKP